MILWLNSWTLFSRFTLKEVNLLWSVSTGKYLFIKDHKWCFFFSACVNFHKNQACEGGEKTERKSVFNFFFKCCQERNRNMFCNLQFTSLPPASVIWHIFFPVSFLYAYVNYNRHTTQILCPSANSHPVSWLWDVLFNLNVLCMLTKVFEYHMSKGLPLPPWRKKQLNAFSYPVPNQICQADVTH